MQYVRVVRQHQHRFFGVSLVSHHSRPLCTKPTKPVLTLFTKEDCSLCDDAVEELKPHLEKVDFRTVDIKAPENKDWLKYRYDIPVFHLNGQFLMKHRANVGLLLEKLEEIQDDSCNK